ncbi:RNA-directed DNA polymerase, eukaryota, reverse transcriptase zinc-binding domain protein [Tanacetum coccineum]
MLTTLLNYGIKVNNLFPYFINTNRNELGKKVFHLHLVEGSKSWVMTLVGYFVGIKMSHREVLGHLRRMWRAYHLDDIIMNECGLCFFKFKAQEGMQYVLENEPWLVDGKPFFVQKWEAGICMTKLAPTKVPLWVKNMNVTLEAWNSEGISRIASMSGKPIIVDRITTSMCEKAYGRASFARVLVDVDTHYYTTGQMLRKFVTEIFRSKYAMGL